MTSSCSIPGLNVARSRFPEPEQDLSAAEGEQRVVLAGGCFWCVEAVLVAMEGVTRVESGYTGGSPDTANYEAVCTGTTGHAEAVEVRYDPARVTFGELLRVFFSVAHDPTQLNRQGNDRGTQYRSAIFYENHEQKRVVESYIRQLTEAGVYSDPIVTALEPLEAFYSAEAQHQDFAARNPNQPYIMAVAAPKVEKLIDGFGDRLKPEYTGTDTDLNARSRSDSGDRLA
ncbi:MAG: peptide-methionine (S)-S-oxide reductase MsrA [Marinobacter sp.]|nr:peptide-methionine (S)-S-oxide reductase MsrA [Marinobacter sp.]